MIPILNAVLNVLILAAIFIIAIYLTRKPTMTVSTNAQPIIDELNAAAEALPGALAAIAAKASSDAEAQAAEDLAAIKAAGDALTAAIAAATS